MENFQIFKSYKGRKTYIVTKNTKVSMSETFEAARKFFKTSPKNIAVVIGYVYKGELYLEDPNKKGTRACWVGFWMK